MKNTTLVIGFWLALYTCVAPGGTSPLPNITLVNQEGKPFQLHDLKGKYLLVSFIYSRCPDPKMCPLTMRLVNHSLRDWKKDLPDKPIHALTVTLDPKTDTAPILKAYGRTHGVDFSRVTLATGNDKVPEDFASEFNVVGFPGKKTISHNIRTVLVGPDLIPLKYFKENEWKPEEVVAAGK